jgi:ADP-ribosylglycohydrolase
MNAYQNNRESCSNGCMMRSVPMAVYASGLGFDDFRKACNAETKLTHPNMTANDAVFLYNLAIRFLMQNHVDP